MAAIKLDVILARQLAFGGPGTTTGSWTVIADEHIGDTPASTRARLIIRDAAGRSYEGAYEEGHDGAGPRPWEHQLTAVFTPARTPALEGARS